MYSYVIQIFETVAFFLFYTAVFFCMKKSLKKEVNSKIMWCISIEMEKTPLVNGLFNKMGTYRQIYLQFEMFLNLKYFYLK